MSPPWGPTLETLQYLVTQRVRWTDVTPVSWLASLTSSCAVDDMTSCENYNLQNEHLWGTSNILLNISGILKRACVLLPRRTTCIDVKCSGKFIDKFCDTILSSKRFNHWGGRRDWGGSERDNCARGERRLSVKFGANCRLFQAWIVALCWPEAAHWVERGGWGASSNVGNSNLYSDSPPLIPHPPLPWDAPSNQFFFDSFLPERIARWKTVGAETDQRISGTILKYFDDFEEREPSSSFDQLLITLQYTQLLYICYVNFIHTRLFCF